LHTVHVRVVTHLKKRPTALRDLQKQQSSQRK
jgi:hypothetical protein